MIQYALFFIIYSFAGWVVESTFRSLVEKGHPVNSGFLMGPFIPIYGFGALSVMAIGTVTAPYPFPAQLVIFTLFVTVLEYVTSVLLEKIFGMKLWDYSNYPIYGRHHIRFPLNINGRVCLFFSLFWAGLISFQIFILNPPVTRIISTIPSPLQYLVLFVFLVYLSVDLYFSARLYLRFAGFLKSVKQLQMGKVTKELQTRLQLLSSNRIMHTFFRPLRAFPHLRDQLSTAWEKMPKGPHPPYLKDIRKVIAVKLPQLKKKNKTGLLKEFFSIGSTIIKRPEYQQLKTIKHHDKDIYTHNLNVAWISFLLAKKFHLHVEEVVKGALLHDFFFYDWRTFRDKDYLLPHGFSHPSISYKNAVKVYGKLTLREKDIILKHMWPLTVIPPKYRESFLVSMVDKAIASVETVKAVMPENKQ